MKIRQEMTKLEILNFHEKFKMAAILSNVVRFSPKSNQILTIWSSTIPVNYRPIGAFLQSVECTQILLRNITQHKNRNEVKVKTLAKKISQGYVAGI